MVWKPGDTKRYRDRAEELRTKADGFGPANRAMMLNMATFYERFAEEAEAEEIAFRRYRRDLNSN